MAVPGHVDPFEAEDVAGPVGQRDFHLRTVQSGRLGQDQVRPEGGRGDDSRNDLRVAEVSPLVPLEGGELEPESASVRRRRVDGGGDGQEADLLGGRAHLERADGGRRETEKLDQRVGQGDDVVRRNDDGRPADPPRVETVELGRRIDELCLDGVAAGVGEEKPGDERVPDRRASPDDGRNDVRPGAAREGRRAARERRRTVVVLDEEARRRARLRSRREVGVTRESGAVRSVRPLREEAYVTGRTGRNRLGVPARLGDEPDLRAHLASELHRETAGIADADHERRPRGVVARESVEIRVFRRGPVHEDLRRGRLRRADLQVDERVGRDGEARSLRSDEYDSLVGVGLCVRGAREAQLERPGGLRCERDENGVAAGRVDDREERDRGDLRLPEDRGDRLAPDVLERESDPRVLQPLTDSEDSCGRWHGEDDVRCAGDDRDRHGRGWGARRVRAARGDCADTMPVRSRRAGEERSVRGAGRLAIQDRREGRRERPLDEVGASRSEAGCGVPRDDVRLSGRDGGRDERDRRSCRDGAVARDGETPERRLLPAAAGAGRPRHDAPAVGRSGPQP